MLFANAPGLGYTKLAMYGFPWFSQLFVPKAAGSSKPGSAQVRHSGEDFGGCPAERWLQRLPPRQG